MATLVTVIHIFVCLFLVLTVLLQPGKGGGMGGAFGGGSTQSVFGGSGGSSVLRKATVFIAAIFMLTSMTLAWLASNTGADALKQFSAAERQKHERREALREAVLEGAEDGAEDGEGLIIDEEMLGDDAPIMDPAGELDPEDLERILEEAEGELGAPAAPEADDLAGEETGDQVETETQAPTSEPETQAPAPEPEAPAPEPETQAPPPADTGDAESAEDHEGAPDAP